MDFQHVHDLLRIFFRCILRSKSETLYRLNLGGITIAYNRETLSESSGFYFYKKGKILWKTILKSLSGQIFVSDECHSVCNHLKKN